MTTVVKSTFDNYFWKSLLTKFQSPFSGGLRWWIYPIPFSMTVMDKPRQLLSANLRSHLCQLFSSNYRRPTFRWLFFLTTVFYQPSMTALWQASLVNFQHLFFGDCRRPTFDINCCQSSMIIFRHYHRPTFSDHFLEVDANFQWCFLTTINWQSFLTTFVQFLTTLFDNYNQPTSGDHSSNANSQLSISFSLTISSWQLKANF